MPSWGYGAQIDLDLPAICIHQIIFGLILIWNMCVHSDQSFISKNIVFSLVQDKLRICSPIDLDLAKNRTWQIKYIEEIIWWLFRCVGTVQESGNGNGLETSQRRKFPTGEMSETHWTYSSRTHTTRFPCRLTFDISDDDFDYVGPCWKDDVISFSWLDLSNIPVW